MCCDNSERDGQRPTAFAFPGVAVKLAGPEARFHHRHATCFSDYLDAASAFAGRNLVDLLDDQQPDRFDDRERQFFTYAFSCGMADVIRSAGLWPELLGGYSFGIYAATVASGAIDFETGLHVLDRAYRVMAAALPLEPCGMGVVVGFSRDEVSAMLQGGRFHDVVLTNTNSDTCQIVSGPQTSLGEFLTHAVSREALTAELLDVAIPYHHPTILAGVTPPFAEFLSELPIADPQVPIISSINLERLTDRAGVIDFLARNLSSPINWRQVVGAFVDRGIERVIECGPGISLSQNRRFMPFDRLDYANVKNAQRKLGL